MRLVSILAVIDFGYEEDRDCASIHDDENPHIQLLNL